MTFLIRKAIVEDAENLQTCMLEAYDGYQERLGEVRLPPMDVDYAIEIQTYPTWVIEVQGNIVAGLIMSFDNQRASIVNIAVAPTSQGKGVGGKLMEFAETKAKEKGFFELHLTTHVLLIENIALYHYLRWQEIGREKSKVFLLKPLDIACRH